MAFAIARFRLRCIKELLVFSIPRKLNEDMCVSSLRLGEGMGFPPSQSEHIIWQLEQCGILSKTNLQELF